MRFKMLRTRTIKFAPKIITKDNEGVPEVTYGEPKELKCELWPAMSELQVKTYGERVNAMSNVKIRGSYTIESDQSFTIDGYNLKEGDGVFVYNDEVPDYKVISIKPYKVLRLEIEKL